jgi:hypothetical protein
MKNQLTQTLQSQKKIIAVLNGNKSTKHGMYGMTTSSGYC